MSPTFTNPYLSPEQHNIDMHGAGGEASESANFHLPGLGGIGPDSHSRQAQQLQDNRGFSRAGAPGTGPPAGLGGLPGLNGLGPFNVSRAGWQPGLTASRGYQDNPGEPSLMSPNGSFGPSLAGFGGFGSYGGPAMARANDYGGTGQPGRLGALLPNAMQEQMRGAESTQRQFSGNRQDESQSGSEDSYRSKRGAYEESGHTRDKLSDYDGPPLSAAQTRNQGPITSGPGSDQQGPGGLQQNRSRMSSGVLSTASGQPPAAQQKTMVMPDRIRWIYKDPTGSKQGPWSGLEMHDWYRAGFFSPELLVKKVEDDDYEPLAQLIRRIGNSREPFLVPQIGIPAPPNTQGSTNWPSQPAVASTNTPAAAAAPSVPAAQPPFASSFPSFGTTLTAEQQNALERRKQEEQYLMARQKEHLAQQQVLVKQMQMQGNPGLLPQQLQHQSSAQSLHSQPSHGSITSPPAAMHSSPMGPIGHLAPGAPISYENAYRAGGMPTGQAGSAELGNIAEEDMASIFQRMNIARGGPGQTLDSVGVGNLGDHRADEQRVNVAFADRARLQQEQQAYLRDQEHSPVYDEHRQHQFQHLQSHRNDDPAQKQADRPLIYQDEADHDEPSLTEQVQKAASAKQSPFVSSQSGWGKPDSVETHPPAQTSSPLPAPAARRGGQNLADALVHQSSQDSSPAVEPLSASLAPWAAKEHTEAHKQPSLKEIQEAEALRAAKQEVAAAAERRVALQRELSSHAVAPAPGLPTASTWGKSEPSMPADGITSAWAKSAALPKTSAVQNKTAGKKTLQQIQKEEEMRKQKAAIAAAASSGNTNNQVSSAGKRYADLASKGTAPSPSATSSASAWTTVGASGKPKMPAATAAPALSRTITGNGSAPSGSTAKPKTSATAGRTSASAVNAFEDFKKWAIGELRPDLAKGIQGMMLARSFI